MNKSYWFFGVVIPKPGLETLPLGVRHKNALQSQGKLKLFWSQTGNFDLFRHCDLVFPPSNLSAEKCSINTIREYDPVNWNASEFWIDGGCRGNQAHGK